MLHLCLTEVINTIDIVRYVQAQQRGALHSHTLVWFRKRQPHPNWTALPCVERVVSGSGPKQRRHESGGSGVPQSQQHRLQYDSCYQLVFFSVCVLVLVDCKCLPVIVLIAYTAGNPRHVVVNTHRNTTKKGRDGTCQCRDGASHRHAAGFWWLRYRKSEDRRFGQDDLDSAQVPACLFANVLPQGWNLFMCYVMSPASVCNTHPHARALPMSCSYLPCLPRIILSVLATRARA